MSYSEKQVMTYNTPEWDYGDGATVDTLSFRGPAGKQGRVIGIGVAVTETFAVDDTPAKLRVGSATDADAYAELNIADGAAADDSFDQTDDTDAIVSGHSIPADSIVEVTGVVGVDAGTEAGMGVGTVITEWW